jgi:ribosomal RNA-processing protein 1
MGYPAISLNEIELVKDGEDDEEEDDDEDDEEMPEEDDEAEPVLDPRAGQLDVDLVQIKFDPARVADMIETFYSVKGLNSTAKKFVKKSVKKYFKIA